MARRRGPGKERGSTLSPKPFATAADLEPLLRPRGIAVVGASAEPGKFSTRLVPTLQACGYTGAIHPVNPRAGRVAGLPCYPDLAAVPDPCDLAIVAVPARSVVEVVGQAADRGVRAAVVLSAGFDELGEAGAARAAALRQLGDRIRIYGPNCPGLWQIRDGLIYTFSTQFDPQMLRAGPVGLVTQGGALGRTVLDAMATGLGFSYWFSTGNEADLEVADFLAFLAEDPGTRILAVIVEGWRDGRRFLEAVDRCRRAGKPVLVLKIGRTATGLGATRGHTGLPNGSPAVADALLRQAGCVLVQDIDELTAVARLAASAPARPGGLAICSFSGGAGGLLADLAEAAGLAVPPLAPDTAADLTALLPEIASVGNPTDMTTAALADPTLIEQALLRLARDPAVAALAFPLPHRLDDFDARLAPRLVELAAVLDKPLAVIAMSPTFPTELAAGILSAGGVQVFASARLAIAALAGWRRLANAPPAAAEAGGAAGERRDLILLARQDPAFGPVVGCEMGSAWPDFRLAPCDQETAAALVAAVASRARLDMDRATVERAARVLVELARTASAGREDEVRVPLGGGRDGVALGAAAIQARR